MQENIPTDRTKVGRMPDRGHYDLQTIHSILDESFLCSVGFIDNESVCVIPTIYARIDNEIFIHGSVGSRMLKILEEGQKVCLTISIIDGLVLARSAFSHSVNYRSVVIFSVGRVVENNEEKMPVFEKLTNQVVPGRWEHVRWPTEQEMRITKVIAFSLSESSAKIRQGPPKDKEFDYEFPTWAGVIPCKISYGEPISDERNRMEMPEYIKRFIG